jgi:hypothetical protein
MLFYSRRGYKETPCWEERAIDGKSHRVSREMGIASDNKS